MAKREKQVYGTNEIAHLWAHQTQQSGSARNAGGNFYYDDFSIYSYGRHFEIARLIPLEGEFQKHVERVTGYKDAPYLVLFTTRTYSSTTAGHIQLAKGAISHLPVLYMPDFIEAGIASSNAGGNNEANWKHESNIKYFVAQAEEARGKCDRARTSWSINNYTATVHTNVKHALHYMKIYGIYDDVSELSAMEAAAYPMRFRDLRMKLVELSTYERVYVVKDPVTEEKREKARASRERSRLKKVEQLKNEWLAGAGKQGFTPEHWYGYQAERKHVAAIEAQYGVLLRLIDNGEMVETTKHATVPAKDAKRLLRYVRLVKETNVDMPEIVAKGLLTVGPYTVNRITKDGDLIVGCHSILNSEIERFAKEQGWMEEVTVESLSN